MPLMKTAWARANRVHRWQAAPARPLRLPEAVGVASEGVNVNVGDGSGGDAEGGARCQYLTLSGSVYRMSALPRKMPPMVATPKAEHITYVQF
ncbi:hypothetical protein FRC12_015904 [Ceratobasidium sp. 428]|nr:hypothetical protein FRC12_015904 [Ceratobasidium sp. 428]